MESDREIRIQAGNLIDVSLNDDCLNHGPPESNEVELDKTSNYLLVPVTDLLALPGVCV